MLHSVNINININYEEINMCLVCEKIVIAHLDMKIFAVIYVIIILIRIILALKLLQL